MPNSMRIRRRYFRRYLRLCESFALSTTPLDRDGRWLAASPAHRLRHEPSAQPDSNSNPSKNNLSESQAPRLAILFFTGPPIVGPHGPCGRPPRRFRARPRAAAKFRGIHGWRPYRGIAASRLASKGGGSTLPHSSTSLRNGLKRHRASSAPPQKTDRIFSAQVISISPVRESAVRRGISITRCAAVGQPVLREK